MSVAPPSETLEILLVEDSRTQALSLKMRLEALGHRVDVVDSARKALNYVATQRPHAIVSDVLMPEMDGYEFCQKVKDDPELRALPVILMTSLSDPEDLIKGLTCGADNFIVKPIEEDYLVAGAKWSAV